MIKSDSVPFINTRKIFIERKSSSYLKDLRILISHVNVDVLDMIEDTLDESHVDRALDFEEASNKLKNNRYDLAIIYVMSLSDLVLLVVAADNGIPTVLVTSNAINPEALRTPITRGVLGHLTKKELSKLDDFLNELLGTSSQSRSTWSLLAENLNICFEKIFKPIVG